VLFLAEISLFRPKKKWLGKFMNFFAFECKFKHLKNILAEFFFQNLHSKKNEK
jgi:hypothetical protein